MITIICDTEEEKMNMIHALEYSNNCFLCGRGGCDNDDYFRCRDCIEDNINFKILSEEVK